jgi:Na+-transporting methylmalonyl-CoA/oxaloacetate decarboxylase gamma subunit
MIGAFFRFLLIGVLALVGIGVALAVLGIAVGLATLALKVGVVVGIGYLVVRMFKPRPKNQISEADRKWLES